MKSIKLARDLMALTTSGLIIIAQGRAIADWQIVARTVVSGNEPSSTNLVVRKMTTTALREDVSPVVSMLFFIPKQEQVVLNHSEKTYVRQNAKAVEESSGATFPVFHEGTTFEGQNAELWRWTNGPAWGCTWIASTAQFLESAPRLSTSLTNPAPVRSDMMPKLSVGSVVGSNSIVICTEHSRRGPVRAATGGAPRPADANFTVKSTLVSIIETNFSPAEFEIPIGYEDRTGQAIQPVQMNPAIFGTKMVDNGNLDFLRKDSEHGRPILELPKGRPAN